MKSNIEKYYALIPVASLCGFCIYQAAGFEVHDFANYYFGGHFLKTGQFTTEIYFPYHFNQMISALGHPPVFAGFAPNTPFLAMLFYPLSFLEIGMAKLIFNVLSALLFVFSLKRLLDFYNVRPLYALLIPIFFFVPLKNELFFGQVYLLLFFLLAESWLAYEKEQHWKTAIFLSLAIMLKVFPVLLIVIFVFKKQFKPLFYTILCWAILCTITLFFCGLDVWIFYFKNVLSKAAEGGIASAYVDNYQSVFMFLKRIFIFDVMENPMGFFNQPLLFSALIFGFKIGVLAAGFYISRKSTNTLLVFSYWIFAMILLSPYGSTYTFLLMLFPYFALAKSDIPNAKRIGFFVLLFLINNLPLSRVLLSCFEISYLRLFALLVLFAVFLSLIWKMVNWKIVSLASIASILVLLIFTKNEPSPSAYFLNKSAPLLIYDYKTENNRLTYFFWNQKGENSQSLSLPFKKIDDADLTRNEIYYFGKRILSDDGNRLKPMVIDGKTLLYLSDHDRGIGFYTLRKIELR
jgi:hypothetical protein